jgi:hypothetical protein
VVDEVWDPAEDDWWVETGPVNDDDQWAEAWARDALAHRDDADRVPRDASIGEDRVPRDVSDDADRVPRDVSDDADRVPRDVSEGADRVLPDVTGPNGTRRWRSRGPT